MITQFHTATYKTTEERAAASLLSREDRQKQIEQLLVQYPLFDRAVGFIGNVHRPVEGGLHGKGMIAGLLGQTRAGKTDICRYYCNRFPMVMTDAGKMVPVVYVPITVDTSPTSLAEYFYVATAAESVPKMKTSSLIRNSIARLARSGTELVILDDAQFMFLQRPKNYVREFAGILKQLADTNSFNVVVVGEESIMDFILSNDALAGRGGFPKTYIKPLRDDDTEFEMFRMLLQKVDRRLPFAKDSGLAGQQTSRDLYAFSGGAIGKVINLVRFAALRALNMNASNIMREHLYEEAALRQRPGDPYEYFGRGD
jgi:hypothetical protein